MHVYMCACVCARLTMLGQRGGAFFFFSTLSKALPVERRILGWPPPTHRYEAVMGRIAAFIEWHLFSPTLHKCSEQNRQESSWGRHFLRLRWQWQTCSNYFKPKQTPRKLPLLLSFVTAFLQAALGFFFFFLIYCWCDLGLCVLRFVWGCMCSWITNFVRTWICSHVHIMGTCFIFWDKKQVFIK